MMNIEKLVKLAKSGDSQAVTMVIKKYEGLIVKEAGKYRIPGYEFEDLVQYGYMTVIKCIRMYDLDACRFNGYVISGIRNNMGYLLRKNIKINREISDDSTCENQADMLDMSIEDHITAYEQVKELYEALDKLDPEERELIETFYLKDQKTVELPKSTTQEYRKMYYRKKVVLQKLRKLMRKEEWNFREEVR